MLRATRAGHGGDVGGEAVTAGERGCRQSRQQKATGAPSDPGAWHPAAGIPNDTCKLFVWGQATQEHLWARSKAGQYQLYKEALHLLMPLFSFPVLLDSPDDFRA